LTTIFDLGMQAFAAWCFPVAGMVFAAAGLLFYVAPKSLVSWSGRAFGPKLPCIFFIIIGSTVTVVSSSLVTLPYLREISALQSGTYKVIEGILTSYQPGRVHPVHNETFVVNNKQFTVVPYTIAGFGGFAMHQTPNLDNPEGAYVRISYLDRNLPIILRIEAEARGR